MLADIIVLIFVFGTLIAAGVAFLAIWVWAMLDARRRMREMQAAQDKSSRGTWCGTSETHGISITTEVPDEIKRKYPPDIPDKCVGCFRFSLEDAKDCKDVKVCPSRLYPGRHPTSDMDYPKEAK